MANRPDSAREGLVIANYGGALLIEETDGALRRCVARQSAGKAVCGDRVSWNPQSDGTGVVLAILPRRSLLERHDDRASRPMCANVDQLVVVATARPGETQAERVLSSGRDLIDCYLAAAERLGIDALLIINKADLAPYVNASLEVMERDTIKVREGRPYVFTDMLRRDGLDEVIAFIEKMGGLKSAAAAE